MKIIKIEPKDIYVTFEISFENLIKLKRVIDMAEIRYDGKDEKEVGAQNYLISEFYPAIREVIEDLERGRHGT